MKVGYANGYIAGELHAVQDFERVLAVLREELADARRDRDAQSSRADAAVDLLLGHLGTKAISLAGQRVEAERTERQIKMTENLSFITDPTEELPYNHPHASFKNAKEASLFSGEDVTTADG